MYPIGGIAQQSRRRAEGPFGSDAIVSDQQCGIAGMLLLPHGGGHRFSLAKVSISDTRRYFTNFNNGRRSASGDGSVSAGGSSANIASHKAFNSESPIRLSLILMSRMATPTNRAVSRLPLSIRPARHSSSVTRIECSLCSESATGFLPL
jgi:hypothetical protein